MNRQAQRELCLSKRAACESLLTIQIDMQSKIELKCREREIEAIVVRRQQDNDMHAMLYEAMLWKGNVLPQSRE